MRLIPVSLFLVLAVGVARAEDAYTIALKVDVDPGKTITTRETLKDTGSIRAFEPDGKLMFERKREAAESAYRTTVLDVDADGLPTRYLRAYEKATETENGKARTFSYQGRTVLLEKKDGTFRLGVVGEPPLDPADVAKLVRAANKKSESAAMLRHLSPGRPVKVGDSWDLPIKPIAEGLDTGVVDQARSRVTAKLTRVYPKGKSRFGTFELTGQFVLTAIAEDGLKMPFDPPARFDLKITLDAAIDGSTTERTEKGTLTLKGEGQLTVGDVKRKVVFDVNGTGTEETSAEADDPKAREVPKVAFAPVAGEWTEFKPKNAAFTVQFPGRPRERTRKSDGATETQWAVQADGGNVAYTLAMTEFKEATRLDPKAVLKTVVATVKGLKEQKEVTVNGHPGIDIEYEQESGGVSFQVWRRVVMVDGRAFELAAVGVKGKKPDAERFFKSFKVPEAKPRDD